TLTNLSARPPRPVRPAQINDNIRAERMMALGYIFTGLDITAQLWADFWPRTQLGSRRVRMPIRIIPMILLIPATQLGCAAPCVLLPGAALKSVAKLEQ